MPDNLNIHITQLYIYPVKSLGGIAVDCAKVTPSGLEGDRQWAVIKETGELITQRQQPKMSQIRPEITGNKLKLNKHGLDSMTVTLDEEAEPYRNIAVWKDTCTGQPATQQVNNWITQALESPTPLKLVNVKSTKSREIDNPARFNVELNSYADAAPFLVANQQSLRALNAALHDQGLPAVDMRHFRPNIVIDGIPAFTEHEITTLKTPNSSQAIKLVDHCSRCIMITIWPDTGLLMGAKGPFKTLASLNAMPNQPKVPAFGVNSIIHPSANFTLAIGDSLFGE